MRFRRPSPAMVVALIALFVALGGTSVAAVSFARNAGAVDGKSAVFSGATLNSAAGKLVATIRSGSDKGKIPSKFVAGVPTSTSFAKRFEVADNQTVAPTALTTLPGIGTITVSCTDENANAGVENPRSDVVFVNQSGSGENFARRVGNGDGTVGLLANGAGDTVTIRGSNTFTWHVQTVDGKHVLVDGIVRQDGLGTPAALCTLIGTVLRVD
jgi:hypothetical protein